MINEGPIRIFLSIQLKNCLVLPNLPYKLLSTSQITKELNCTVLMTANECVVQDAQTQKIICYGTEHRGLYHLNNTTSFQGELICSRQNDDADLFFLGASSISVIPRPNLRGSVGK